MQVITTRGYFASLLYIFCTLCDLTQGERCGSGEINVVANFNPQTFSSPGYPRKYETDDDCTWKILAAVRDTDYSMQLVSVVMDINDPNGDCSTDYIEIYEGENAETGQKVATWCGRENKFLKTSSRNLVVKFHSDGQYTSQGFTLEYNLVKQANLACVEDQPGDVEIGLAPVVDEFKGSMNVGSCEWKIHARDTDSKLVIEMFKPSGVACDKGSFIFYEEEADSSDIEFEYCSTKKPFSKMFLSTNTAVIRFQSHVPSEPDGVVLKIYTRSGLYDCDDADSLPTIEVSNAPVFFSLPYLSNTRGSPCSVRLWSPDDKFHLRLDVMGSEEESVTCDSNLVSVAKPNQNMVDKSCNRGVNPVYRVDDNSMIVTPKITSNIYMRATAVYYQCDGLPNEQNAYPDLVLKMTLPEDKDYSNLSQCRLLISARSEGEIVHLSVNWKLPLLESGGFSDSTTCPGDFLNIFDGDSETSPVLYSSCNQAQREGDIVQATVVSGGRQLLLVMDADAKMEGMPLSIEYHSIPGGQHCSEREKVVVSQVPKTLTSLNYPDAFPLKQSCLYDLMTEEADDVIIVEVVDSKLGGHCESMLVVYEGRYDGERDTHVVGRVCGSDDGKFKIAGGLGTLLSVSKDSSGPGGWKVQVYTEAKNEGSSGDWLRGNLLLVTLLTAYTQLREWL